MGIKQERTTTSFNLSIGSGLAFESLFKPTTERYDPEREIPNHVNLQEYDYCIFNIQTLIRNIINAFKLPQGGSLTYAMVKQEKKLLKELKETLADELVMIDTLFSNNTRCQPVIFIPTYKGIRAMLEHTREKYTKSKVYLDSMLISKDIHQIVEKEHMQILDSYTADYKYPSDWLKAHCLTMTHVSYDLFNRCKRLDMIESHTGILRSKDMFRYRFHGVGKDGKADFAHMPFLEETLYVLGDRSFTRPFDIKVRRMLVKISYDYKWTPLSSAGHIRNSILRTPEMAGVLFHFKPFY